MRSVKNETKAKEFLDKLTDWRNKSRYLSLNELITYLFDETGYYYYVSLLPNGETRQGNLKALLKKATDFEKSSFKGLYNFLTFIKNVKESSGDMDAPSDLSENDDVVRIMSIHKSKGLEFPIVILSGMGRKFNKKDLQNPIVCHQDLGFGFDIVDSKLKEFRHETTDIHIYYLPDPNITNPVPNFEIKWYEAEEICQFKDNPNITEDEIKAIIIPNYNNILFYISQLFLTFLSLLEH